MSFHVMLSAQAKLDFWVGSRRYKSYITTIHAFPAQYSLSSLCWHQRNRRLGHRVADHTYYHLDRFPIALSCRDEERLLRIAARDWRVRICAACARNDLEPP